MKLIGTRFGDHQIVREIARGTSAHVFLASDGVDARAVKAYPTGAEARADRELRFGRDLSHSNLNPVHGRLELNGRPAILMPYVPGKRFGRWIRSASRRERLAVVDGILAGLEDLHGRGIVHRDVKPDNVLVTGAGRAVLVDFDLAIDIGDDRDRRTSAGTAAFLSPEQARGEPAEPASDLYAAGILLYRAITGEMPYTGSAGEVLESHRSATPRRPSSFHASLAPFDRVIARLLAKDPRRRYPDAAAVRAAVAAAAAE